MAKPKYIAECRFISDCMLHSLLSAEGNTKMNDTQRDSQGMRCEKIYISLSIMKIKLMIYYV